jgi:hypothetical protein
MASRPQSVQSASIKMPVTVLRLVVGSIPSFGIACCPGRSGSTASSIPLTSPPEIVQRPVDPAPPAAPGDYRIEFDWRGETAFCVEHDRRVRLACFYWGGPKGSVSHIDAMRDYADGRREELTADERALVLQRVIDEARKRENIRLEVEGG